MDNIPNFKNITKEHESLRLHVYADPLTGDPTVGWGHMDQSMVIGTERTIQQCEAYFEADWEIAETDYDKLNLDIDPIRKGIVIMMLFNLGYPKLRLWRRFLGALVAHDYKMAALEMGVNGNNDGPSKRRTQIPARAHREMAGMLTGFWV